MKVNLFFLITSVVLFSSCSKYVADFKTGNCSDLQQSSKYSKATELENALDELVQKGVPGVVLAVQSDEGYWATAKGYAKIEDQAPMQLCHLQYLQSISKTYMAIAILKLHEQGKLEFGGPFLLEDMGGMMVATKDVSQEELDAFAVADPAVQAGLLKYEIPPWLTAMEHESINRKEKP